ncbi:hypothetical protein Kpol_191p4 [Vanderwaltozyma polyspora DSM 70294]|uniref:Uncharacterized protein n=1 Tax=Vanderwaltozyma polyspora (strain ATCC 22028 / DSM 70294 / BCRC 21397 / CBS 2163 / NBRC 10782 / NRRL Y-8283 / UCD 57-17) TaxID=436907 RepID=A7TTL5_VANPO|nr:uncharacterized protein Kpol_191p4 [Vanderwaltozyma polyspora DSM 70294]EDO14395.1 hypothetical protein Kpol_191p4 [Vanderwaltozyma polyspora DSM 70294]
MLQNIVINNNNNIINNVTNVIKKENFNFIASYSNNKPLKSSHVQNNVINSGNKSMSPLLISNHKNSDDDDKDKDKKCVNDKDNNDNNASNNNNNNDDDDENKNKNKDKDKDKDKDKNLINNDNNDDYNDKYNRIGLDNSSHIIGNNYSDHNDGNNLLPTVTSIKSEGISGIDELHMASDGIIPIKQLDSHIFFPPTNVHIMNLLNFDSKQSSIELIYSSNDTPGIISQRNGSWESVVTNLIQMDPINKYYSMRIAHNNPIEDISYIEIDDKNFVDFIWSICNNTLCVGQFCLFPQKKFEEMMAMLKSLDQDYPIIHRVIRYTVATFMKDLYHKQGLFELSNMWDTLVRIPSIRPCLDIMNQRINACNNYIECVSLAFSVALLFSPHSTGLNSEWRSHLSGLYTLTRKACSLLNEKVLLTENGKNAFSLFGMINALFCRTEVCAYIAADNGGILTTVDGLNTSYNVEPFSKFHILSDSFDLAVGCTTAIYPVCRKITEELLRWKQQGINLSGTNLVKFKYTNTNGDFRNYLFQFGSKMLEDLVKDAKKCDTKKALKDVDDYKLRFTISKCNDLDVYSLQLYLKVFFLNQEHSNLSEIIEILETILEAWYSMPYSKTVGIKTHWAIYYSALVSIVIQHSNLTTHFVKILDDIARTGLDMAINSTKKLRYISDILQSKEYDKLIDPSTADYIVY